MWGGTEASGAFMNASDLRRRVAWLIGIRAIISTLLLGGAIVAQVRSPGSFPVNPFFFLVALTYALTIAYASSLRFVERYHPSFPCLAEDGSDAFGRYRVRVTPFGFVIGGDGRILAKGLCGDQARLRGLLEAADLPDIARSLPAMAQPIQAMSRNPAPAGRVSAVAAASNGVEESEQ